MKDGYRLAVLITAFAFLMGATATTGQEPTPFNRESRNSTLPDAPPATNLTACTDNDGKTCPEWVHKLVGQYPPSPDSADLKSMRDPSTVHFWTYRGWQEPPLRTNKQVFHSKLFLGAHIGGAVAMIVACRSKTSKEHWGSEVPAVAARLGLDYLQFRFVGGPNAIASPAYQMIHYGRASAR